MSDERYSVTFDYLTKGGKPAVLYGPPSVAMVGGPGAASQSNNVVGGAIATAIVSSLLSGLLGAFAKTKSLSLPVKAPVPKSVSIPVKQYNPSTFTQKQIDAIKEHARKQADAANDLFNKGQADSVAKILKRNEEERKRLIQQRDMYLELHKDAMRKLVSPRKLEQAKEHVNTLNMKQVMSESSKIEYQGISEVKLPSRYVPLKGETIPLEIYTPKESLKPIIPQMQLQQQQNQRMQQIELTPPASNAQTIKGIDKQNGLNELQQ